MCKEGATEVALCALAGGGDRCAMPLFPSYCSWFEVLAYDGLVVWKVGEVGCS